MIIPVNIIGNISFLLCSSFPVHVTLRTNVCNYTNLSFNSLTHFFVTAFVMQCRILDRGSMFVFSNAQFQRLIGVTDPWKASRLLDLGAGDGKVTSVIEQHFDEVYATEQSPSMRWRLGSRGFKYVLL